MMKTLFIRILRFLMLLIFIASCGIGYVIYEDTLTAVVDTCWYGAFDCSCYYPIL